MIAFQGAIQLPPDEPFDPASRGAQVVIEDTNPTIPMGVLAITTYDGGAIPGSSAGVCDVRDGWRVGGSGPSYRNKSTALDPPTCTPGTAKGLTTLKFHDRRVNDGTITFKLTTKNSMVGYTPQDSLRATIVFGGEVAAIQAGECASTHTAGALPCTPRGSTGVRCQLPP
jgi:hypothetical protein